MPRSLEGSFSAGRAAWPCTAGSRPERRGGCCTEPASSRNARRCGSPAAASAGRSQAPPGPRLRPRHLAQDPFFFFFNPDTLQIDYIASILGK